MSVLSEAAAGSRVLLMGNEAIARGALEAGVQFVAGYPGTPASEIVGSLARVAKELGIYVQWSVNEKVGTEAAAAASLAGVRGLSAMKNAGLSVALDFLLHLSYSGLGDQPGGFVVVVCDDPEGHSSGDETDSRWLAKWADIPLLEPDGPQEAKDVVKWAFQLSEEVKGLCLVRSYTRLSHASGTVTLEALPQPKNGAHFDTSQVISPYLAKTRHAELEARLEKVRELFEESPFNWYRGPEEPELVVICSGSGSPFAQEAVEQLGLEQAVGILKLGTLWPLPRKLIGSHLARTNKVLVVEEVDPFLENHVKEIAFETHPTPSNLQVYGRDSGHLPFVGETTPDSVLAALSRIFDLDSPVQDAEYSAKIQEADEMLIPRGLTWCAGCPHRASFWIIRKAIRRDGRDGFVTGDIGCYTLDVFPGGGGNQQTKALHAMGSGVGLAAGFGKLQQFGFTQPLIAVCGDSTFFHAAIPALVNAVYSGANMIMVLLDNRSTAMTGFQPHPGTGFDAVGDPAPVVDIEELCRGLGCKVVVSDPFDLEGSTTKLRALMKEEEGVRILILRRTCELIRMREEKKLPYRVWVDVEECRGETCGFCSRMYKCPALVWDRETGTAQVMEAVCSGCAACVEICPFGAIHMEQNL
jgi:indolepyruvate ferredoxin oxidoreductase alpha subunit